MNPYLAHVNSGQTNYHQYGQATQKPKMSFGKQSTPQIKTVYKENIAKAHQGLGSRHHPSFQKEKSATGLSGKVSKTAYHQTKKEKIEAPMQKTRQAEKVINSHRPVNFAPLGYNSSPVFDFGAAKPFAQSNTQQLLKELNVDREKRQHSEIPKVYKGTKTCQTREGKIISLNYLDEGSFHIVFRSNKKNVLYKFIHPDLNLSHNHRDGVLNYREKVLQTGFKSYNQLKEMGFKVPIIYNNPLKDGFYEIEEIHGEANIELFKVCSLNGLDSDSIGQLMQVREVLLTMYKHNKLLVPDFKPHNVRFDQNNKLTIIDFCEDWNIPAFTKPLKSLLNEYADFWSNGNVEIYDYLMEGIN